MKPLFENSGRGAPATLSALGDPWGRSRRKAPDWLFLLDALPHQGSALNPFLGSLGAP